MSRSVPKIPKIDSYLSERQIIDKCEDLFQGMKGNGRQARNQIRWLRAHVPENHPLRFRGEFCYYCLHHTPTVNQFKRTFQQKGHFPIYVWEKLA